MALVWKRGQLSQQAPPVLLSTEININNQGNKRAADESDGAQQSSASKKPRRNPRGKPIAGRAKQTKRRTEQRAQAKKRKAEAESEESEREAGGGAEGKPDAV